jgi:hypothetical protein
VSINDWEARGPYADEMDARYEAHIDAMRDEQRDRVQWQIDCAPDDECLDWRDAYMQEPDEVLSPPEDYCDYCERVGHTFRSCPRRDDGPDDDF